jgi:hypothetical protein
MASWRDRASPECQVDLDGLLSATLPFAQQQLDKRHGFYPFGAVVGADGTVHPTMGYDGHEVPASEDLLRLLIEGARNQSGEIRAAAFVADVKLPDEPTDAIRVELEHREGIALAVLVPYVAHTMGGGITYQPLRAVSGQRRIWI